MQNNSVTFKVFVIAVIGGACLIASFAIMGLTSERRETGREATDEVARLWGGRQAIIGPILINKSVIAGLPRETFLLPDALRYQTELIPEVRSRGNFKTVVYKSVLKVDGEFKRTDIAPIFADSPNTLLLVGISDTRGIEKQFNLTWRGNSISFEPGTCFMHGHLADDLV